MMKLLKILLIGLIFNVFIINVNADGNVYDDYTIKYKWYKYDIVDENYVSRGKKLDNYIEDDNKIIYGSFSNWDTKYCDYSHYKYDIEEEYERVYQNVIGINYLKISNFGDDNFRVRVIENNSIVDFQFIKSDREEMIIKFDHELDIDSIVIFVDMDGFYDITLSYDSDFSRLAGYQSFMNQKILIPDSTWIHENTSYVSLNSNILFMDNDFRKLTGTNKTCRIREIKSYRYKMDKVYYDDKYYERLDGYIPDMDSRIVNYNGRIPMVPIEITNTVIETEEIIKNIPVKEYIYLDNKIICESIDKDVKYIENDVIKNIKYIPNYIYYVILFLILCLAFENIYLIIRKKDKFYI